MKHYIIFGQKRFNYTQEKPLKESQIITLFWKESKDLIKKRKDLTIEKIEELFDVLIEEAIKIKDYVIQKEDLTLVRSDYIETVIFYSSKEKAENDLQEGEKIIKYCDYAKQKIAKSSTQYKYKRHKEAKIDPTYKELAKSRGLKERMAIVTFINQKKFKHIAYDDSYLGEYIEETLLELNKYFLKKLNNYQLMKIFDVSEKTISNWKNIAKSYCIK